MKAKTISCRSHLRQDPLGVWLAGLSRAVLLSGGLLVTSQAAAVDLVGADAPVGVVIASDDPHLDSVLVEKRQGEPLAEEEAPELEPISQLSEFEPELADPADAPLPPIEAEQTSLEQDADIAPAKAEGRVASRAAALVNQATLTKGIADLAPDTESGLHPAKFRGVTPGRSTRAELIAAWGEPDRRSAAKGDTAGGEVLGYNIKSFERVEALVEAGKVAVVRVALGEPATVASLVGRLKLEGIEPVEVLDPSSSELLAVVFPEKGLTLLLQPAGPNGAKVSHLVLEPNDPRAFVLRSEQRPPHDLEARLADLRLAIEVAPDDAHAHWLKAQQHLAAGQAAEAEEAAAKASALAPADPSYRLTLAESLREAAEFDESVLETRKVLDDETAPRIVRAGALDLMGRLAAMGDKRIANKSIDFHNAAIEIADSLATSDDLQERRLAKDILVSAHLSVAQEIARRDYADKETSVAEWVGRASGIAEERIEADGGGLELRLQVARGSLGALAQMRQAKDPGPWIVEAQETADALLATCDDPLTRARIHWELGEAYQHGVRIEHLRGDAQQALAYGTRAIAELSEGAAPRTTSPAAERLVGQLYFYLGAVNAVHRENHEEAIGWYDKGRDILTTTTIDSEFVVPRRDGEELVSMGVSYWNQGQKDLAVELTEEGARLMERAAKAGVISSDDLAVPYGNLTAMYKRLDNSVKALEYGRLVRSVKGDEAANDIEKPAAEQAKPAAKPQAVAKTAPAATPKPAVKPSATPAPKRVTQQPAAPSDETPRVSRSLGRPSFRQTISR